MITALKRTTCVLPALAFNFLVSIELCFAQLEDAEDIVGEGGADLRKAIEDVVKTILKYVALIAVIVGTRPDVSWFFL
jgi:hypothetical protein